MESGFGEKVGKVGCDGVEENGPTFSSSVSGPPILSAIIAFWKSTEPKRMMV